MVDWSKTLKVLVGTALLSSPLISCTGKYSKFELNKKTGRFEYGNKSISKLQLTIKAGSDYNYDSSLKKFCLDQEKRNAWLTSHNEYLRNGSEPTYQFQNSTSNKDQIPSYLNIYEQEGQINTDEPDVQMSTPIIERTFKPKTAQVPTANVVGGIEDTFLANLPGQNNTTNMSSEINLFNSDINLEDSGSDNTQSRESNSTDIAFGSMATQKTLHQRELEARVVRDRIEQEYMDRSHLYAKTANTFYTSGIDNQLSAHLPRLAEMYKFYMFDSDLEESEFLLFKNLQELNARVNAIYQFIGDVDKSSLEKNKQVIQEAIEEEMKTDRNKPISKRVKQKQLLEDLVGTIQNSFNFVRDYETDHQFLSKHYVQPVLEQVQDSQVSKYLTVDPINRKISTALNWFNLFDIKEKTVTVSDEDSNRANKKGWISNEKAEVLVLTYKNNNGLISNFRAGKNRYHVLSQNIESAIENLTGVDVSFNPHSQYTSIELVKCGGGSNAKEKFENNIKSRLSRIGMALTYAKIDPKVPHADIVNRQIEDLRKFLLEDKVSKDESSIFSKVTEFFGAKVETKDEISEQALKLAYNQFNKKDIYSFSDFKDVFTTSKDTISRLMHDTNLYHIVPELTKTVAETSGMRDLPRFRIDYRMFTAPNGSNIGALTFLMHNKRNNDSMTLLVNPGISKIVNEVAQLLKNTKSNINSDFPVPLNSLYKQYLESIIMSEDAQEIIEKVNDETKLAKVN